MESTPQVKMCTLGVKGPMYNLMISTHTGLWERVFRGGHKVPIGQISMWLPGPRARHKHLSVMAQLHLGTEGAEVKKRAPNVGRADVLAEIRPLTCVGRWVTAPCPSCPSIHACPGQLSSMRVSLLGDLPLVCKQMLQACTSWQTRTPFLPYGIYTLTSVPLFVQSLWGWPPLPFKMACPLEYSQYCKGSSLRAKLIFGESHK